MLPPIGSSGPATPADRLSARIAHEIGVAIACGQHQPGDTLPGEVETCERLQVSRTAYREAVRMLTAKGMVETRPRTGTRVLPRAQWHLLDPEIMAWSFEGEPTEAFLRSLFELREIIEPEAAALAATRRSTHDLMQLGAALSQMDQFDLGTREGQAADQLFHRLVLQASDNELLGALSATVQAAVGYVTEFKSRKRKLVRDARPDHHRIFEAIAAAQPEQARSAMLAHIQYGRAEAYAAVGAPRAED